MDRSTNQDCPVCMGDLQNPSQPVPCCRKVFCQSCLRQAILLRPWCPYCRSPINDHAAPAFRSAIQRGIGLQASGASFRTTQAVGPNVQALLDQLRSTNARHSQMSRAPNAILPNQVAPNAAVRPVPTPRVHIQPSVTPAPNPIRVQANTSPQLDLQSDDPNDMDWHVQIAQMENASHSGPLDQLRATNARHSQMSRAPNAILPNQVAPNAAVRPGPTPRVHIQPSVTPAPNPIRVQANTSPQLDLQSDDPNDMDWHVQIAQMENASHSRNIIRTYNCPYCQDGGLDDLDLRDHCNYNHLNDQRQVVCPVCVSLPHGNPTYSSRNFIGHLNLRHSYYIDDISNIYQTDDANLQEAILRSWQQT